MHQYYIKITRYTEAGALTNEVKLISADTPQKLCDLVTQYSSMYYQDEEGKATGIKMYKVVPCITRVCELTNAEYADIKSIYGCV